VPTTRNLSARRHFVTSLPCSLTRSNWLSLNSGKTEITWVSTTKRQHQLLMSPMLTDSSLIHLTRSVQFLRVLIDAYLVMRTQVTRAASRPTSSAANSSTSVIFDTADAGRVVSPKYLLDYTNTMSADLPALILDTHCLQSVLNAADRPTYGLRRHDHATDALITLHWLQIPERIRCKLSVLVHRVIHGTVLSYLGSLLSGHSTK
jgi:hypothetical protein